jgi:hypothetical protein
MERQEAEARRIQRAKLAAVEAERREEDRRRRVQAAALAEWRSQHPFMRYFYKPADPLAKVSQHRKTAGTTERVTTTMPEIIEPAEPDAAEPDEAEPDVAVPAKPREAVAGNLPPHRRPAIAAAGALREQRWEFFELERAAWVERSSRPEIDSEELENQLAALWELYQRTLDLDRLDGIR